MAQTGADIRFERFAWKPAPGTGARCLAALVVSFLLFGPYLANVSRDYTRVCYFWRLSDTLGLVLLVVLVAGLFVVVGEVIRWTNRAVAIRLFRHAFVVGLGLGLVANVAFILPKLHLLNWTPSPNSKTVACIAVLLIATAAFINKKSRLAKRCQLLCQAISPAVPLTFASLLLQQNYPEQVDPLPIVGQPCAATVHEGGTARGGIYVLLFDEWSYERTFDSGQPLSRFANLAAFTQEATVYHNASSPAGNTEASLPGILYQTNDAVVVDRGRFGFEHEGKFVSARECQNMFSRLGPLGFQTAMIGFALPYRSWLGDSVDVCRSRCYYERGEDAASGLRMHLLNAIGYAPDPWTQRWYKRMEARSIHSVICGILGNTRHDMSTIVREWPTNTFLFAHVHLPHMPAVLNSDLKFRDPKQTAWGDADLAGYESNLQAVDATIGEFVAELRRAGKYDNSVVVLTSDHSWRNDPERTSGRSSVPITHVPLLVKAPGQVQPASVNSKFETKNLGALIESLVGRKSEPGVLITENCRK